LCICKFESRSPWSLYMYYMHIHMRSIMSLTDSMVGSLGACGVHNIKVADC
jgi:hypothetical protein